ncbi:hypothetical protein Taro_001955 [Colocasia esculenta]|uniref:Uncharacterized protein n=1 Tax=Colocasia esculenta TaxID=4460 RepID=A0A843TKD1_COLES|nr:hypothetical protein [Colocasia esculenta]
MNDGGNSQRRLFHALPARPVSVKREVEDGVGPASAVLPPPPSTTSSMAAAGAENAPPIDRGEQEEALAALVEFRSKEVERLRLRLEYYKSQVEDAEKKLSDSKAKLALLQSHSGAPSLRSPLEAKGSAKPSVVNGGVTVKEEETSPARGSEQQLRPQLPVAVPPPEQQRRQQQQRQPQPQPQPQPQSRPPLIIPAVRPKPVIPSSTDARVMGRAGRPEAMVAATSASVVASSPGVLGTRASPSHSSQSGEVINRLKRGVPSTPSPDKCRVIKNSKMKFVHKEHTDLVSSVRRSSSPSTIRFQPGVHVSSDHKRKLRCLEINPVQDQLFVTSLFVCALGQA